MTGNASADNLLALVRLGTKVNMLERCRVLAEAKGVYVRLHPETRHGGKKNKLVPRTAPPAFINYAAGLTGRSVSSIKMAISIWNSLLPEIRARLSGLPISDNQSELRALSKRPPAAQRLALDRLLAGEIDSFTGPVGTSRLPDLTKVPRRDLIAELWRRETSNG